MPFSSGTRTFIADFKTGLQDEAHMDDLRFYALVETLRSGVPPYRVATYYLDEGQYRLEDVDEALLLAAVERVVTGVQSIIRVETGAELTYTAGPTCRYCPAQRDCSEGQEWLATFGGGWIRLPGDESHERPFPQVSVTS